MPIHEAVTATVAPKPVEQPIPSRTVSTRSIPQKQTTPETFTDQPNSNRSESVSAESETTAESVKLSPQLSALARKEQAFRQREQALKAREKELEAKLADADQYSQLKAKIGSKDFSEAERLGLNYEEYTQYLLNKQAGEDPQTQALKALEAEVQALKKGTEDKATQEYEDTVAEYRKEIASLASTSNEFLRCKKKGEEATAAATQLILDCWEIDGEELTVHEALRLVELKYKEDFEALSLDPPAEQVERKLPPPKSGSKTLSHTMAAIGTEKKPVKSLQFMSEAERYAEARRRALEKMEKVN